MVQTILNPLVLKRSSAIKLLDFFVTLKICKSPQRSCSFYIICRSSADCMSVLNKYFMRLMFFDEKCVY